MSSASCPAPDQPDQPDPPHEPDPSYLLPAFHIERHEVPGVRFVSRSADLPRPHVGIFAALHGDEPCGLVAHEWLIQCAMSDTLPLEGGTLVLIHGNVEASKLGERYTPTGYDLNRICDLAFREQLPQQQWGYEHHRAIELSPVFADLDAAIDLHSASSPTVPFGVALAGSLDLARGVALRWVTHGWEAVSDIAGGVALAQVDSRGKPTLAVECGQHLQASANDVAKRVTGELLDALGLWNAPVVAPSTQRDIVQIVAALPKPTEGFRFTAPLRGFEPIEEGQLLGRDGELEVRAPVGGYAVLPNDAVPLRKNVVYIAQ